MPVVVQLSDTHLRADPANFREAFGPPDDALARTVDAVLATGVRPDLVVLTGDLADDGSVEALLRVRAQAGRLGAPILALAGNHDLDASIVEVFGSPVPVTIGEWRVVPVITNVAGREDGEVDVDTALASIGDSPTLVVAHHPPVSPSTHPIFGLVHGDEWVGRLAGHPNVLAMATGHLHEAFERTAGSVTVVGAPSTLNALAHDGPTFRLDPDGFVGAQVIILGPGDSVRRELISRIT